MGDIVAAFCFVLFGENNCFFRGRNPQKCQQINFSRRYTLFQELCCPRTLFRTFQTCSERSEHSERPNIPNHGRPWPAMVEQCSEQCSGHCSERCSDQQCPEQCTRTTQSRRYTSFGADQTIRRLKDRPIPFQMVCRYGPLWNGCFYKRYEGDPNQELFSIKSNLAFWKS